MQPSQTHRTKPGSLPDLITVKIQILYKKTTMSQFFNIDSVGCQVKNLSKGERKNIATLFLLLFFIKKTCNINIRQSLYK